MKPQLSEISELFALAEEKIKLIEHLGEGLTFPSVNQLRYVAFHLLRADKAPDENLRKEELRKAKNHCERAIYDAVEPGIVHYLEEIRTFQNDYRMVEITNIIPNYLDISRKADESSGFISERIKDSISDRSNNQGDQYQEATSLFEGLKEAVKLLSYARPELNKKLRKYRLMFLVSVATLIVAAMGVIVSLMK